MSEISLGRFYDRSRSRRILDELNFALKNSSTNELRGWALGIPSSAGTIAIICYGLGPLAVGYLLWEIALSRARVHSLSMVGAVTPILSTILLCVFLRSTPGPELIVAAFLVSAGVLLSVRELKLEH